MDNFASFFNLEISDLVEARSEAETMSKAGCDSDNSNKEGARCDAFLWLPGPDTATGDINASLKNI